jgi:4-aminobutyrate aminotransferase-like enzyme
VAAIRQAQGLSGEEIVRLSREHVFFSWSVQRAVDPIPVAGGEGVYYWDPEGRRYMDFSSQLMNLNIGYQHPKVVAAIQAQAAKLCGRRSGAQGSPGGTPQPNRARRPEQGVLRAGGCRGQ